MLLSRSLACTLLLLVPAIAAAADPVTLPNPWREGAAFEYADEALDSDDTGTATSRTRSTEVMVISIAPADAGEWLQSWKSRDYTVETLEGDATEGELMQTAVRAVADLPVTAVLDAQGRFARVGNLDAFAERLPAVTRPLVRKLVEDYLVATPAETQAIFRGKEEEMVDEILAAVLTPAMLDAAFGEQLRHFDRFVGASIEPGTWISREVGMLLPESGERIAARLEYRLTLRGEHDALVEWRTRIDPVKGRDAAWAFMAKETDGQAEPRDGLPPGLEIAEDGLVLVDMATGAVELYENTRTEAVLERRSVTRDRMRLRTGGHGHAWKDDASGVDAIVD